MDTTTVATVLGSNFFIALVSLVTAKWQINNAKEQLDRQIRNERKRTQAERKREIRSEPLIRFRKELALFAAQSTSVIAMYSSQKSSEEYRKLFQETLDYAVGGEIYKSLYALDDKEIINMVHEVQRYLSSSPNVVDKPEVIELIGNIEDKIIEIQSLINNRLEEL